MANATSENSVDGKKITELKVVELRSELEKRGLDKTGIKAVLIERLEKALESEGKVPADYLFAESELKSKKSAGLISKDSPENETKDDEEGEENEEDTNEMLATDEPLSQNDSAEKKDLAVENSDKMMDIEAPSVDVEENEVQNTINNEAETSPDKPIKLKEDEKEEENTDLKEDNNSKIKTNPVSADPPALPPQSSSSSPSSSADVKTKEEDKQNDADKSTLASTQDDSAPTSLNDTKEGEEETTPNAVCDLLPPTPTSVPCVAPLTLKDTINMDTSTAQQSEENESLIVHVDDTQNDLDADLLTSQANGLKSREAAKEKVIGKTDGKQSDVKSSPPEVGSEGSGVEGGGVAIEGGDANKGNTDGKTEKKADEKKDDKDGKLKSSSSVSKLKVIKNLKDGNQNNRNLWITGLSSDVQASELKEIFSKYGKVVAVKVMTNTRAPGTQCYVFLTMSSSEEASKCIQHLDKTEVNGKKISVDRAKKDLTQTIKKVGTKLGEKKKVAKKDGIGQNIRNLWVSGLSSNTRATDLKRLFSKYGKVIDAKVVTNIRSPGARCYGFLTMSSLAEANKCIQHLNQTELHGRMISVEKAKNDPVSQTAKKLESKPGEKKTEKPEVKKEEKKVGDKKDGEKKSLKKEGGKNEVKKDEKDKKSVHKRDDKRPSSSGSNQKNSDKSRVVLDKSKGKHVPSGKRTNKESGGEKKISTSKEKLSTKSKPSESEKDKNKESKKDILSFNHIRAERERECLRQSERRLREKERKHLQELDRARTIQKDVQRRQREEALRLERIKERLRMDREKLEREMFEKERLRIERERIREERCRLELFRIEEQQRRALKRSYEKSHIQETFWDEPKKPNLNTPSSRFHHTIHAEPRFTELEHRGGYERRVEHYDRRDARSINTAAAAASGRFEERKDRDFARRDIGHVRDVHDERHPDERNHPDNRFERREVGPNRDRTNERNHENDRRNISAHDRLGRVRNSPVVSSPAPDQLPAWGAGLDRKVDNWSHPHGNMNNNVNRPNDRWINNNMVSNHDRSSNNSGGFVGGGNSGSSGMVQNMRPGNIFVNSQNQSSAMGSGGGSGNMGGRMQEPRFDAYKHMQIY